MTTIIAVFAFLGIVIGGSAALAMIGLKLNEKEESES